MRKIFSENNFIFRSTCSLVSHIHISEINISVASKVQLKKWGAVRELLFSLELLSKANEKENEEGVAARNIFEKEKKREFSWP